MVVRVMMDLFQHRYYRLNKTLMTLIGQWPYQSTRTRRGFLAVIIVFITGQIVSRILSFVKYRDNWGVLLECASSFFSDLVCVTNLIGFMGNSEKTFKLLNRIRTDWQEWAWHREVNILHEYAEQGKNMTIAYTDLSNLHTAITYTVLIVFGTEPLIQKIIDILLKNGTKPGEFPIFVDYYHLDAQKYYFYITMYTYVMLFMLLMVIITNNVMLVSYVQHVCGIFAALGHKLERIGINDTSMERGETLYAIQKRDVIHLSWCIDRHNDAIEYANYIEATYTWNVFFTIGFGMILINVLGLQILISTSEAGVNARFVAFALSLISLFCLECCISQILMDHSLSIRFHIYNCRWYRLSLEAQRLLQFMAMRCKVPCQLTAGKMLIMSVRTFGLTFRTALSYFAVVRSTQGI